MRLLWLLLLVTVYAQEDDDLVVETYYGQVRGTRNADGNYISFTGIPYATAPTGQNRFLSPLPPPSWDEIFEANRNDVLCPQILNGVFTGIEDCLTLNIFKPDETSSAEPVPVIVFIHGGAYSYGSNSHYTPDHLMSQGVIVVMINYRLGPLGFLSLGHEFAPGNAAFKDQVAALRWIQQNIAAFGGDQDSVTIFGQSAGGASVDLLTLSPLATGLFNRAISMSGTSRSTWAFNDNPISYATELAETYLDYEGSDIDELLQVYLDTDAETLMSVAFQYSISTDFNGRLPFSACAENVFPGVEAFLTEKPANILASGDYNSIPIIYTVTNKEFVNMISSTDIINEVKENIAEYLPPDLIYEWNQDRTAAASRVLEYYFNDETTDLEGYINFRSDTSFYYSIIRTAKERLATSSEPIYFLEFSYESAVRQARLAEATDISGVGHADDLFFLVFPTPADPIFTDYDQQTMDRYTLLFTNFAKYGNPTPEISDLINLEWHSVSADEFHYLELGSDPIASTSPHETAMALWESIYIEAQRPIVQTTYGLVKGTHDEEGGFYSFTGIHYAQAPTGQNRFMSPQPPLSWDEVFEANRNDILCPQILNGVFVGTEDCLTLNIFKPEQMSSTEPLPVLVFIHGGAYSYGSNSHYTPDHLMSHGVIVVMINYRLGPLGFLSLGHEFAPGNAAFKDQVAALRWIQQNIAAFGGDPDSVTIFGQSAGGASVDLLTLSPLAAGLFNKAISMSGTSRSTWAFNDNPLSYATELAVTYLSYEGNDIDELLQVYLDTDAETLMSVAFQYSISTDFNGRLPFSACAENVFPGVEAFLTEKPANILASGDYNSIPIIYTVTNKEFVNMISSTDIVDEVKANIAEYLPPDLIYEWDQHRTAAASRVLEYYFNDETTDLEGYINFRSDTSFYYSIIRTAKERLATSSEPIYFLEFSYESAVRQARLAEAADISGVGHADDLFFLVFPTPADPTFTDYDQQTMDRYTLLFTNFAKYGNPTPEISDLVNLEWQSISADEFHYLELGLDPIASTSPHETAMALWESIYIEAQRPIVPTTNGFVRGTHDKEGGFYSFTGIRYAWAPTGQYRFTSPLPPTVWPDVFEADRNDIFCPQILNGVFVGIEDCLMLNIFKPDQILSTEPHPVLVFIHGGAYRFGSNSQYTPDHLMSQGVMLVTINYRLGPLGFLSLGHELAPGNAAFKDQVAALRWIQENIAAFGGDPDSITIFGQSAGGASVDLLTLSPLARGLFNRAISMSGTSRSTWAFNDNPLSYATELAETYLSYEGNDIDELLQIYLNTDAETLMSVELEYSNSADFNGRLPFTACAENIFPEVEAFLTEKPANILASGDYNAIPIIYTVTNKEFVNMISSTDFITEVKENMVEYLPPDLIFEWDQDRTAAANRVLEYYFTDETTDLESYINFRSDTMFYYSVLRTAKERLATSSEPIYVLEFTYESEVRLARLAEAADISGVGHADDLFFLVFPTPADATFTDDDQQTMNRYTLLFSNFAKYGNPTPAVSVIMNQQWQSISDDEFHYLELGSIPIASISPNEAAVTLWESIYSEAQLDRPVVQTTYGLVRGTHDEEGGFSSFTGIHYAQVPTGQYRFTDPLPPTSWDDLFDANQNDIYCPQFTDGGYRGTEDCLTLNVYVPDTASTTNPLSVIVFVHGGSYVGGSNAIYGADYLMARDVVLVNINFRVGLLGLLCLGHELAPGNVAFKDQIAALRWVQQNIAAFGGDPNSVTIMGHSSGGASVDLLTLSPLATGLFHRAVSLSASSRATWAVNANPIGTAISMAQRFLNYQGDSIEELLQVYINANTAELVLAATIDLMGHMDGSLPVGACVEESLPGVEAFLTDTPANILAAGAYTPVPIIYGITSREYLTMVSDQEILDVDNMIENLVDFIPADLAAIFNFREQRVEIADQMREFYVTEERSTIESYIDYVSDGIFYYGSLRAAKERQVTSSEPVYFLEFAYESSLRLPRSSLIEDLAGVGHGDDLVFLVVPLYRFMPISENDQLTIDRYTTLIANFAKFGDPTPQVSVQLNQQWQPIYEDEFHYLTLDTIPVASLSPHEPAMTLWENIYTEALMDRPVVQTAYGLVRGTRDEEGGFSSFTGIRYAEAPTGQLRFTGPLTPSSWTGIFEANRNNIYCPQRVNNAFVGTADCLTLNIYVPNTASATNRAAVMVYIYGGSYYSGSNAEYGPDHLMSKEVVLVTINFRVGAFGLLCLGHELAPGNAGLKDQVAALRWIQENIGEFGGDPNRVTIVGQNSGAASVDLLTLSPMTQGLFHRAISLSGSSRTPWAVSADPIAYATTLARRYLNYNSDNISDLVQLYLSTSNSALATATYRYSMDLTDGTLPFAACVEEILPGVDAFLTDTPANILQSGEYTSVPIIYASTSKEYVNLVTLSDIPIVNQVVNNLGNYLPNDLVFQSEYQKEETIDQIWEFYFNSGVTNMEGYIDFQSDTMITLGVLRAARERQVRSTEPIYMLEFTYESELRWGRITQVSMIRGVGHADDLLYLVAPTPASITVTNADRLTIDRYTTLFSNFAKYGHPTPQTARLGSINWSPITENSITYLDLGVELTSSQGSRATAIGLWDQAYVDADVTPGPNTPTPSPNTPTPSPNTPTPPPNTPTPSPNTPTPSPDTPTPLPTTPTPSSANSILSTTLYIVLALLLSFRYLRL